MPPSNTKLPNAFIIQKPGEQQYSPGFLFAKRGIIKFVMQINPRTPLLRELNMAWQLYLSGKEKPFLASYKLTYDCNLRCLPCPYHSYPASQADYSLTIKTLHSLRDRGNQIVVFEGGEPLLWKDKPYSIHDIIRAAKKLFPCVGMTTNGTLPLDVETDILWVSIDGLEPTHNLLRGAEIYQKVMDNIRNSSHPRLLAHITINGINFPEVPQIIQSLHQLVHGFTIQLYYPYDNTNPELNLTHKDRSWVLAQVMDLKHKGLPIFNSWSGLRALSDKKWNCAPTLIDNANPDGTITNGCYLQNRADINCMLCGFSPIIEISLTKQMDFSAIMNGMKLFL